MKTPFAWLIFLLPFITGCNEQDSFIPPAIHECGLPEEIMQPEGWAIEMLEVNPSIYGTKDFAFVNEKEGYLLAGKTLFKTSDGGFSWESSTPFPEHLEPRSISFSDFEHGAISGTFFDYEDPCGGSQYCAKPILLKTADGGLTWTETLLDINADFYHVHFADSLTGCGIIRLKANGQVKLYNTADGGKNWLPASNVSLSGWTELHFPDKANGYVLGANDALYRTMDGGLTWEISSIIPLSLTEVQFLDSLHGFGASYHEKRFFKTADGGKTWQLLAESRIRYFHFFNKNDGLVLFNEGRSWCNNGAYRFAVTSDGGLTWKETEQFTGWRLADAQFPGPATGYGRFDETIIKFRKI